MEHLDTPRLVYLVILGSAIGLWFFVQNRAARGKLAQYAAIWGLIFLGAIAVVGLWGDIRQTVQPRQSMMDGGRIEVPRAPDGHYYLTAEVNGVPLRLVVDTGASQIVLSQSDARRAGIDTEDLVYTGRAFTANGEVRTAPVRLGPRHECSRGGERRRDGGIASGHGVSAALLKGRDHRRSPGAGAVAVSASPPLQIAPRPPSFWP